MAEHTNKPAQPIPESIEIDPVNRKIGSLLMRLRKMNGWTQKYVADLFSASQSSIFNVEKGLIKMPSTWLIILFDKHRVNPMFVLGLSKTPYLDGKQKGYGENDKIPMQGAPENAI